MDRSRGLWAGALALVMMMVAAACAPEVPEDPDVQRNQVVFDSEAGTIPLPSDLALDEQGTLPDLPGVGEDTAQGAFADYFTSLHGWLPTTPISIPVTGDVDPESLSADDLLIYRLSGDEPGSIDVGSISYDAEAGEIVATPAEPLAFNTTYGYVLAGEVLDTDGNPVVTAQTLFFAFSSAPLVDEQGNITNDLLAGAATPEEAAQLEQVRQFLQPVVEMAVAEGVDRADLLAASVWTTAKDPIAVFNSDTGTIPLPSDAALDEEGTLPDLPGIEEASAQGDFLKYLSTLHGWLPSTPLEVTFSRALNEDSVTTDAVTFFQIAADGTATELDVSEVTQTENEDGTVTLTIVPAQPLDLGTQYGYVVTDDLTGDITLGGQEVTVPAKPDLPLALARLDQPVVDESGSLVEQLSDEQATLLEGARQLFAPTYAAAEAAGIDRENIVAATFWHTALDPFAVFDPTAGVVPFPNEFIRTGENDTVNIPIPDDADQLTTAVITELNSRDGFSITADGYLPIQSSNPLDPATITKTNMPIAWVQDGSPVVYEDDRYFLDYVEDFSAITFGPTNLPFVQGVTNAGIATTDITDTEGYSLKPTSAFVFLRSQHPVFADGASTVEQLSDAQAEQLEDARQAYQQLFLAALVLGYSDRTQIAVAWAFDTDVATEYQQQLNAQAEAIANDGGSPGVAADPTSAEADPTEFTNVGLIQRAAAYETVWYIDPNAPGGLLDEPTTQTVPITVTVPSDANCTAPYPVVIVGHGDTGERADAVGLYADPLAAECLATVALDFPLHGQRTPQGSTSGELFLTANAIATKNNFLQAVVDLAVLTEVIKEDGLEAALDADTGTDLIDESSIGYAGYSLGSLIGTNFLATDADVNVGALTTPGAKLTDIVLGGALSSILDDLPGDLQPGTFDFFQTINFLQWIVEPGDPWTFAPHVQTEPLSPVTYDVGTEEFTVDDGNDLPASEVLLQMAGQDNVIPNSSTERLATAIGVTLDDTTFPDSDHSFIFGSGQAAQCAKDQVAAWLSSGLTSDAALPSGLENACGITAP